jgi:hypothetical protein
VETNLDAVISPYIVNIAVYFAERVTVALIRVNNSRTYLLSIFCVKIF